MTTRLHFWDDGDPTTGIGRNETVIELALDGYNAEETADKIAHAKDVLTKALVEIWDNGTVHVMTGAELAAHNGESVRDPFAEAEVNVTIIARGDGENTPAEVVHHTLSKARDAGHIVAWSDAS